MTHCDVSALGTSHPNKVGSSFQPYFQSSAVCDAQLTNYRLSFRLSLVRPPPIHKNLWSLCVRSMLY